MSSEVQEQAAPPKKKTKLIILMVVAVLAIGAGAYWYLFMGTGKSAEAGSKEMKTVNLPSCTVNLADPGGKRYLKTSITLEYSDKKLEEELPLSLYKVKDSVLGVLRHTTVSQLDSPEDLEVLKQELLKAVNAQLNKGQVSGLYFEEFLVQ